MTIFIKEISTDLDFLDTLLDWAGNAFDVEFSEDSGFVSYDGLAKFSFKMKKL